MPYGTIKNGRYIGRGDDIRGLIVGEHSEAHYWMPALPYGQMGLQWYGMQNNGATYNAPDFTEVISGSGGIAMGAGGLLLTTGSLSANNTAIQALRARAVAAGKKMIAAARITLDDPSNAGMVFGFNTTDSDGYFAGVESGQFALVYLAKGATNQVVVGRTRDGTTASNSGTLISTMAANTAYDFVVVVDGTSAAHFFAKAASSESWTHVVKTNNLPASGQSLRFSVEVANSAAASRTLTISYFAFWYEV